MQIGNRSERVETSRQRAADRPDSSPVYGYPQRPVRASRLTLDRVIRFLLGAAVVAVAAWLLWYFSNLVIYLLVGLLVAYLMAPIADRLQGLGLGRIAAILLTFLVVFGGIGVLIRYLIPFVGGQLADLSQQVSVETVSQVAASIEGYVGRFVPVEPGSIIEGLTRGFDALLQGDRIGQAVGSAVDLFTDIFYAVIVIPFVAFFILKDGVTIRHSLLRLVPNRYFEITLALGENIESTLGRYFRALLLQGLAVATVATLLLSVVGLKYALAVGIFTGLANTIPYFGPFMGFLAGTLVGIAQTGDFSLVFGVLVAMGLTQVTDNVIFQPFIFSRAAKAHPLVILLVVLMGAQLAGIVGMLVAIPLTTVLRVTVKQILWSLRNYRILRTA